MEMTNTLVVPVSEISAVGQARRKAQEIASRLGFDEGDAGKLSIVVTEAATNLAKHAGGGEILLGALEANGIGGVQVLALDRGPGIANVLRSLGDGYSTAGSPGTGLGAIQRLAGQFDIYSSPGLGTAILARLWAGSTPALRPRPGLEFAGIAATRPGESVCGDAWAAHQNHGRAAFLIADGLGHGPEAALAAREAVRIFQAAPETAPGDLIDRVHGALRSTRGAAVAVADLNLATRSLCFAGIGNISATILSDGRTRSLVSHNGTVGHQMRRVQEFTYPWPDDGLLVLHTDGLATHWDLAAYAGLGARHPALIAGVLYRDFKRGRDDVTVVVAREARDGRPTGP
jgi:anti-sigma regulatory factor (Ser/Thr protein kinase)